jgi:quercetin dioxygenase-like cupin family protein
MEVTRNNRDTTKGSSEWFTGDVYIDPVAAPSHGSRLSVSNVHFTPGARTAWHRHPNGQNLYVTEGVGRVGRRDGDVEVIQPGDRVFFEPGEDHWHGASPTRFMTHLSIVEVDEGGNSATWGDHVTDNEYGAGQPREDRAGE